MKAARNLLLMVSLALALFLVPDLPGLIYPRQGGETERPEQVKVGIAAWVPLSAVKGLREEYYSQGRVPLCRDLPPPQQGEPTQALSCYLLVDSVGDEED